jgi:uncharacterized protein
MSVEAPELRATLSTADINDLPDEDFAFIEAGGEKDDEGKTTPRDLRHYPVQDKAHADDARARANAAVAGDDAEAKAIAEKALPKIKAAIAKFSGNAKRSAGRTKERHRAVQLIPEVRVYATGGLEIREADTAGNLVTITGVPIVYDTWYPVVDRKGEFRERMLPGVARDVMATDTRFLFNHDPDKVMARAGGATPTLTLEDGPTELRMVATVDTRQSYTNDLVIAIERGDVNQMSVGFLCDRDEWNRSRDERSVKHFKTMTDLSSVTYPASPTTSVEIAQRMAQAAGAEPGARIRRLYVDYRSGAVLNAQLKGQVIDAVKGLHTVLKSAGFDPADLIEGEELGDGVDELEATDDMPLEPTDMGASDDGAIGGDALPPGDAAGPDGRSEDAATHSDAPATAAERRAAIESPSYDDQRQKVCEALSAYLAGIGASTDLWLCDLGVDWVVYETWGGDSGPSCGQFKLSYSQAGDDISFDGTPARVDRHTEWVPAPEQKSSAAITELRAQYRAREYRRISV